MGATDAPELCALCQQSSELRDSHFLPAGFYKRLHRSNPGHGPVVVSKNVALETTKQITEQLLCADCEDRFNRLGEKWVLENAWQPNGRFPIREVLLAARPDSPGDELQIYDARRFSAIDRDKLVYFGASVFWRATKTWKRSDGFTRLGLGPFEEQLRQFLLGASEFPGDCALSLGVAESDGLVASGILPYLKNKDGRRKQYNFILLGLMFDLFVGRQMGNERRSMCLHRSPAPPIFLGKTVDTAFMNSLGALVKTARVVGRLKR